MTFEWDADKAAANLKKHDVSFEEAREVFKDPNAFSFFDADHSSIEEIRSNIIGFSIAFKKNPSSVRAPSALKTSCFLEKSFFSSGAKRPQNKLFFRIVLKWFIVRQVFQDIGSQNKLFFRIVLKWFIVRQVFQGIGSQNKLFFRIVLRALGARTRCNLFLKVYSRRLLLVAYTDQPGHVC